MLRTDNFNVYLGSPSFEGKLDKREKWMQTDYGYEKFSEELL